MACFRSGSLVEDAKLSKMMEMLTDLSASVHQLSHKVDSQTSMLDQQVNKYHFVQSRFGKRTAAGCQTAFARI